MIDILEQLARAHALLEHKITSEPSDRVHESNSTRSAKYSVQDALDKVREELKK